MNEKKQQLIEWIERNENRMISFLQALVSVPSDNPDGDCEAIALCVHKHLLDFDFSSTLYPVDEQTTRSVGMINVSNSITEELIGSGKGPVIALQAHGDVVPPGLGWSVDPYGGIIKDGRLYGRGAAVSKSDIAAYTFAVMALRECDISKSGKLVLAFTFDEETGGDIGPKWLLDQKKLQADAVISAGFTHSAIIAHNGCLHLEVSVQGKSAHAAIPNTGVDAIEAAMKLLQSIYTYREGLSNIQSSIKGINSPTLNVGLISGGINTNVVPDLCTFRIDRRLIPEENPEQVELELTNYIREAATQIPGIQVSTKRLMLANSYGPVPEDIPLIQTLKQNWSLIMGGELPLQGVPLYADARHFYNSGIPTVMFGAGPKTLEEANGHRADEHVRLDDLKNATKITAITLYDLLDEFSDGS